jgi:hypothetical protein
MQKLVIDCATGSERHMDLSPEELAERQAAADTWLIMEQTRAAEAAVVSENLERVKALAQSAVGVRLDNLTAAQVKALLAVLLWSHGAMGSGGAIRPLSEWAK